MDHPLDGCFTADTKIALVDGRILTIEELLVEQKYKINYVYTVNETKHLIEPKPIKKVFRTKIVTELCEIILSNGQPIYCTPEHRFMLADYKYKQACKIEIGQYLKSNCIDKSYKIIYNNIIQIEHIPVYDLEIEDNHNFALACGVFVHNSKDLSDSFAGAIYNASTFEEIASFDLQLMDVVEDINEDMDDLIKEQQLFAQQLAASTFNRDKLRQENENKNLPELESLFGTSDALSHNPNDKYSKVNGKYVSNDDFIFF